MFSDAKDMARSQSAVMIDEFLKPKGIRNAKVIKAIESVPRHRFVPQALQSHAYSNRALPIGFDQTISQPYIVALMSQEIIQAGQKNVLEIGTGCGYQTAILSKLFERVYSIERISSLANQAKTKMDELGINNVLIRTGQGALGWKEFAPYDAIMITAAVKGELPKLLVDQLKMGGVMVLPIEHEDGHQKLMAYIKSEHGLKGKFLCECIFVPFVV